MADHHFLLLGLGHGGESLGGVQDPGQEGNVARARRRVHAMGQHPPERPVDGGLFAVWVIPGRVLRLSASPTAAGDHFYRVDSDVTGRGHPKELLGIATVIGVTEHGSAKRKHYGVEVETSKSLQVDSRRRRPVPGDTDPAGKTLIPQLKQRLQRTAGAGDLVQGLHIPTE